jgi:hypothetical protein
MFPLEIFLSANFSENVYLNANNNIFTIFFCKEEKIMEEINYYISKHLYKWNPK